MKTYFQLEIPPYIEFDYESITKNLNASFTISIRKEFLKDNQMNLMIRGKVAHLDSSKYLWFTGSPKIEYLHDIVGKFSMFLSDIPLHDKTREVLLVREQKHDVSTLKRQLQVMTNRLKEASKKLALGKINTESILDLSLIHI